MRRTFRILASVLSCVGLSACAATFYGYQSSGAGSSSSVTSASVAATASSSHAITSFSYGPRIPASAPGGQVTVSSGSGAALGVAVLVGILAGYIVEQEGPKPLPAGTRLLHTCSCYGYQPTVSSE